MAVYKEPKTNTWRVIYRYTDWNGERKQSQKRGFQTKREAQSWEREQLNKLGSDLDMTFRSFVEHYEEDRRSRIKDSTWESKEHIIRTKLLPYFGKLKMSSITPQQIVRWQNELINYRDKDASGQTHPQRFNILLIVLTEGKSYCPLFSRNLLIFLAPQVGWS